MLSCNFFIKYAKENQKGFCWLVASSSLPKHATWTHVPTHTCTAPPMTSVRNWDLVYAGRRHQWIETSRKASLWQAKPWDCTCSSSQVLRKGRTAGDRFCCRFVAWDLSTDFLEISPWHSAAPGSYMLQYILHNCGVPFPEWSYIVPKKEQRCPCRDAVPKESQSLRFNPLQASSSRQGSLSLSELMLTAALASLWHIQYRQWWI